MNYSVIILAAGSGSRMNLGYNKMFAKISGQPIVSLTSKLFLNDPNCTQLIYVVNPQETDEMRNLLIENNSFNSKCEIAVGGKERQDSVYNGLRNVKNDIVLIHDGARPFITIDLVNQLLSETKKHGCAIPGVRVKDTIKLTENGFIKETIPREELYAVQTPQGCLTELIRRVHQEAKRNNILCTDEASLIERYSNNKVKIVDSYYENIKITTIEDLQYASSLASKYFKEES